MLAREQALPIQAFKGLDRSSPLPQPGLTRSLLNVNVREGKVTGRGGVTYNSTFGSAMTESVTGIALFTGTDLAVTALRIGATKVEKSLNAGAWSDITGTPLTGAATDKPQWAMFRDILYFTNDGQDRPRYWIGSGNTAEIASAPWALSILSYYGFLFLFNVSDNGTNFFTRAARYSEDPQNDWTLCEGNELVFNETQGGIVTSGVFGRTALVLKDDGLVYLRWIGGPVRFAQELAKGAKGTLAPLAGQSIGEQGYIYLGTDYELYVATANDIVPLPPRVGEILQSDLYKAKVANCRSCIVEADEQYNLFFPLDSAGNKGRIQLNYRTGEFSYSTYPSHPWSAVESVRWTETATEAPIGAVSTVVYSLDSTAKVDQISAGSDQAVSRYYDTDWVQYSNQNEGRVIQSASQFTGSTLVFNALSYGKCAVSVAIDHKNDFRFRKVYDLRPKHSTDEYTTVRYDVPPIQGEWFNLRIEFLPSASANPTLRAGWLHFIPSPDKRDVNRSGSISES